MDKMTAAIDRREAPGGVPEHPSPTAANGRNGEGDNAFGRPRGFLGNRFVYVVISQRAHGLSVGINFNPDKRCNFNCAYCEVNRDVKGGDARVDLARLATELEELLHLTCQHRLRELPYFRTVPDELLELKSVALSGDGEPTLSPQFAEIVREVVHARSCGRFPFFKLVLLTNTAGLDRPEVQAGLELLTSRDEIWAKLDAGSQAYMDRVNRGDLRLEKVLSNILQLGRERPLVIQSLFPAIDDQEPPPKEIDQYVRRLQELKRRGARISLVQVYSAHRPPHHPNCSHLKLKTLSRIAQRVRDVTGLCAEVF
jgi:wyosine [tRNA(Phe)-imidazoG37] synthetase (radical SAM superfamily)